MRRVNKFVIALVILSVLFFSPTAFSAYRYELIPAVLEALDAAGDNRGQLEQVLLHYAELDDTLKLDAAFFLIGNMDGHSYVTYKLVDTVGDEVQLNVLEYANYDSLIVFLNGIEKSRGTLDYKRKEVINDLDTITADFLIEQIDYAFRAWREKPWAKGLSFDQFCEYVLPYRGSNEPLELWRETFWNMYADIEGKMTNPSDPVEATKLINGDVAKWFKFDPRYYLHPTDQGMAEMLEVQLGRCEDMTNVTIYAMRANGLGVTSDYTPFWANTGNNHAWNAVLTSDGRVVPFMGAEANPGEYQLANKLAKVYRKTYSKQLNNPAFIAHKQEKVPGWLAGKNYADVTSDYVPVTDVTVKLDRPVPDSVDLGYICVFNSGEWQTIQWGRIAGDKITFVGMGRGIAYLPGLYLDEKIVGWGIPFVLTDSGSIVEYRADTAQLVSLELLSTTRRTQEISTDGIAVSYLTPGKEYELFYWNNDGWQSVGKAIATDKPLVFDNVPSGGIYWLVEDGSDREERIFTIVDGRQVWW